MRAITDLELDLVAGGLTTDTVYGDEIVVRGTRPPQSFPPFFTPPYVGDPSYPSFGGGSGDPHLRTPPPIWHRGMT